MNYAVREALAGFRRAPLLTGLAAGMVGLALFVVGLFGLVTHNLRVALDLVEARVEVVAYLGDDASAAEIDGAVQSMRDQPEVSEVIFVSKDSALARAQRDLSDFQEVFAGLEINPLPASLEVRLADGSRDPGTVELIASIAEALPIVEDVQFGREWVDRLDTLRRLAGAASLGLGFAFAVVAALIIGTALRIAIFARRDEIYVMRLVGARDGFIRRPFLLEGFLTGLAGGVVAVLLTGLAYRLVGRFLFDVEWLPFAWVLGGLAVGTVLGGFASMMAVRRHLREVT
ncbi:MAG: ABC transporter permease [Gemmatimonadetes bacterium]|nr:ABC transporter permease [Gemmatimonadota bacterium]NNF38656.1 ABC transporter permease [Gemmatimonadota bacterium]NNK64983.1 ABC transporter permease [Gemmatimonadota bacterium]